MIDELGVYQFAVFVVQHHVGPEEVQHRDISQVDDVVGIAVDVVTVVVEVIERDVIQGTEHQTKDAIDHGSSGVGVPSDGNHRAAPYNGSGTVRPCGRRQRTAPVVVRVVPVELITIVVVAVVIAVLRIVAVIATVLTVVVVSTRPVAFLAAVIIVDTTVAIVTSIVAIMVVVDTTIAIVAIAIVAIALVAVVTSIGLVVATIGPVAVSTIGPVAVSAGSAVRFAHSAGTGGRDGVAVGSFASAGNGLYGGRLVSAAYRSAGRVAGGASGRAGRDAAAAAAVGCTTHTCTPVVVTAIVAGATVHTGAVVRGAGAAVHGGTVVRGVGARPCYRAAIVGGAAACSATVHLWGSRVVTAHTGARAAATHGWCR